MFCVFRFRHKYLAETKKMQSDNLDHIDKVWKQAVHNASQIAKRVTQVQAHQENIDNRSVADVILGLAGLSFFGACFVTFKRFFFG